MRWATGGVVLVVAGACSGPSPAAPKPAPPPPPPAPACAECCTDADLSIEIDPASTLAFRPYLCTLRLEGSYAMEVLLPDPPAASFELFCQEQPPPEHALVIRYHGAPVTDAPITDLTDPYDTNASEHATRVSYHFGANQQHRLARGELRFQRPPHALIEPGISGNDDLVVLTVDLVFEGDRRLLATLRICPTYADYRPVSDPP